jgi:hypothetical protein
MAANGPFPFGNDQVGGNASAPGAGVGDVVDSDFAALFDADLLDIERCLLVVVEMPQEFGILGKQS